MSVLRSLSARALRLPFKQSFTHASATRASMQSLWVEASDSEQRRGHGEGCPREYVTGESLDDAMAFVAAVQSELPGHVGDTRTLVRWVASNRSRIDAHPAAWCAVELALLDLFGHGACASVETLLGLPVLSGRFRYTAILGDASPADFEAALARYRRAGFEDFKVKLSGDTGRDSQKVGALRAAGIAPARVRADANNLWRDATTASAALGSLGFSFDALEEPLRAGDIAGMATLAERLGCAIILDESAVRVGQLRHLPSGTRWRVNLRVSKMGGLLRSLEFARCAADAGLPIIVGAHVGETSLLTRAALTLVSACRESVLAQEGAFGTHLLERDVVSPSLMFGAAGVLDSASVPAGPGFGLSPVLD